MKNLILMAAAGAGKTYKICCNALEKIKKRECKHILIVTYTNRNVETIQEEIKQQNFGVLSPYITIKPWISFLLNEIIKPYQTCYADFLQNEINTINFKGRPSRYEKHRFKEYYVDSHKNLYITTVAELAKNIIQNSHAVKRLSEIFQCIYIDEIQDLNGYSLEVLKSLLNSSIPIIGVGDPRQATLRTEQTIKNRKVSGKKIIDWFSKLEESGILEMKHLLETRRCCQPICDFANSMFSDNLDIKSVCLKPDKDIPYGVFMIQKENFPYYYRWCIPKVLRYDKRTDTGVYKSMNFGISKGMTFPHVAIFPNKTFEKFIFKQEKLKTPEKYYVAVTRARYSIAFVVDKFPTDSEEEVVELHLPCGSIPVVIIR